MVLVFHNKKMLQAAGYILIPPRETMRESNYHRYRSSFRCFAVISAFIPPFLFGIISIYYQWRADKSLQLGCEEKANKNNTKSLNWATVGYISGIIAYWVVFAAAIISNTLPIWPTSVPPELYQTRTFSSQLPSAEPTTQSWKLDKETRYAEIQRKNMKRCIVAKKNFLKLRDPVFIDKLNVLSELRNITTAKCTFNITLRDERETIAAVPLCDTLWNMERWSNKSRNTCQQLGVTLPDIAPFSREFESISKYCPEIRELRRHIQLPAFCKTRFYNIISPDKNEDSVYNNGSGSLLL